MPRIGKDAVEIIKTNAPAMVTRRVVGDTFAGEIGGNLEIGDKCRTGILADLHGIAEMIVMAMSEEHVGGTERTGDRQTFGDDPYPYGIKDNRDMLQTIVDFSHEQGLTKEKVNVEDMFAPSTLDL